jgi:exoribonuclease-2
MSSVYLPPDSLALYKNRPARVIHTGERLEIELENGEIQKVRPKDVLLLHPGPLGGLAGLQRVAAASPQEGDVQTAWEILLDLPGEHTLAELAELIYGAYTPATAWMSWWWLADGLFFRGSPETLFACTPEEVDATRASRQARADEARQWLDFMERARQGKITSQDRPFLRDVEELAWGRRDHSRVLRDLGRTETPQAAQALLLEAGIWDAQVNPHPVRLAVPISAPNPTLSPLPAAPRLDLTHLPAFAIDDPGNRDPDDAISLDGERIWVHVADAAGLVPPDSPADLEARNRAATLYLPEGPVPMLPPQIIPQLGLGLTEVSPALSFGLTLTAQGNLAEIEIHPSLVRVQRLTYEQAQLRIEESPFLQLYPLAMRYQARRRAAGALFIHLPEIKIHVVDGLVDIYPIRSLPIRECVQEAMLMAGEAAARYAQAHRLPIPYVSQDAPLPPPAGERRPPQNMDSTHQLSLSEMYALRRLQRPGRAGIQPALHAGLGLEAYARATSPLRRYLDIVTHQQLRLHLAGKSPLNDQQILERVGVSEALLGSLNQAETLSERHWTLVYLLQHPGWQGEGVLVEKKGLRGKFILPELALDIQHHLRQDLPLDSRLALTFKDANLPELEAYFQISGA